MSDYISENFKKIASKKNPHLGERKLLKNIKKGFENQEFKMYLQFIVDSKHIRDKAPAFTPSMYGGKYMSLNVLSVISAGAQFVPFTG